MIMTRVSPTPVTVTLVLVLVTLVTARPPLSVRLGCVLPKDSPNLQEIFGLSVNSINLNPDLLNSTRVDSYPQYTSAGASSSLLSSYEAGCSLLRYSVLAFFTTGLGSRGAGVVADLATEFHVPHLATEILPAQEMADSQYSRYLAPTRQDLTLSAFHTVKALKVQRMALVTHSPTSILDTISLVEELQRAGIEVLVIDLSHGDVRPDLVSIRNKGISTCVVDVGAHLVKALIGQAMQAGLVGPGTTFIFTTLDFESLDLSFAVKSGAAYIGYSIIDKEHLNSIQDKDVTRFVLRSYQAALLYDAVQLFAIGLQDLSQQTDLEIPRLSCEKRQEVYQQGEALNASLDRVEFQGVTGYISLRGKTRGELRLRILRLAGDGGRIEVGVWTRSSRGGQVEGRLLEAVTEARQEGLERLVVVVEEEEDDEDGGRGKQRLERIMQRLQQKYNIRYRYLTGKFDSDQQYLQYESVLYGNLPVTREGLQQHEFTIPYSAQTVTILTQVGKASLLPEAVVLSGCLVFGLLLTSVFLSLTSRLSPYQRQAGVISVWESAWISLTSLLLLRTWEVNIKAVSSRLVLVCWWVFCLCALLSAPYIMARGSQEKEDGNLARILRDNNLLLATTNNTRVLQFLQASVNPEIRELMNRLENSSHEYSLAGGLKRAQQQQNFGLLLPTEGVTVVEGLTATPVGQVPLRLAARKGSVWIDRLNTAILEVLEDEPEPTSRKESGGSENPNDILNTLSLEGKVAYGGLGLVLAASVLALLLAILELFHFSRLHRRNSESCWRGFTLELKSVLRRQTDSYSFGINHHHHHQQQQQQPPVTPSHYSAYSHQAGPPFPPVVSSPGRHRQPLSPTTRKGGEGRGVNESPSVTDRLLAKQARADQVENSRL